MTHPPVSLSVPPTPSSKTGDSSKSTHETCWKHGACRFCSWAAKSPEHMLKPRPPPRERNSWDQNTPQLMHTDPLVDRRMGIPAHGWLPAAAPPDRWAAGEARPLMLAATGRLTRWVSKAFVPPITAAPVPAGYRLDPDSPKPSYDWASGYPRNRLKTNQFPVSAGRKSRPSPLPGPPHPLRLPTKEITSLRWIFGV